MCVDAKREARRDAFKPRACGEGEGGNPCGGPVDPRARPMDGSIGRGMDGWMGVVAASEGRSVGGAAGPIRCVRQVSRTDSVSSHLW